MTASIVCVHHWRIARPQGEFSDGVCLNCGETRSFRNSYDEEAASLGKFSKQNGGKNKKLTPGQAAFGHQSIRPTYNTEGVAGKNGRVRS